MTAEEKIEKIKSILVSVDLSMLIIRTKHPNGLSAAGVEGVLDLLCEKISEVVYDD